MRRIFWILILRFESPSSYINNNSVVYFFHRRIFVVHAKKQKNRRKKYQSHISRGTWKEKWLEFWLYALNIAGDDHRGTFHRFFGLKFLYSSFIETTTAFHLGKYTICISATNSRRWLGHGKWLCVCEWVSAMRVWIGWEQEKLN